MDTRKRMVYSQWYSKQGLGDICIGTTENTVIDYIMVNESIHESVKSCRISEMMDADHMPLLMEIATKESGNGQKEKERDKGEGEDMKIS